MGTAATTATAPVTHQQKMSFEQRWLHHPETLRVHRVLFQVHLWLGMLAAMYVTVMSLSGSMLVFRDRLESSAAPNSTRFRAIEWACKFPRESAVGRCGTAAERRRRHCVSSDLLTGAVVWWPGIAHWRRSLTVNWRSSLARVNWDLHNTLGACAFLFLAIWGLSGIYFALPGVVLSLGRCRPLEYIQVLSLCQCGPGVVHESAFRPVRLGHRNLMDAHRPGPCRARFHRHLHVLPSNLHTQRRSPAKVSSCGKSERVLQSNLSAERFSRSTCFIVQSLGAFSGRQCTNFVPCRNLPPVK